LEDVDGMMTLKSVLHKIWECQQDSCDSEYGPVANCCERSNGRSDFTKGWEAGNFLTAQRLFVFPRKTAQWGELIQNTCFC
jgi:hypothetical protein